MKLSTLFFIFTLLSSLCLYMVFAPSHSFVDKYDEVSIMDKLANSRFNTNIHYIAALISK